MASTVAFPDSSSSVSVPSNSVSVTCTAPVNIAVIKYWGKRDETLILPINSSLSATIHQGSMMANTLITASRHYDAHSLTLNGKTEKINGRLQAVINELQKRAGDYVDDNGRTIISASEWPHYRLSIVSVNNFPTAAGLASSAAGYACFTRCLAELYNFKESFAGELTTIARQGSGSACRSLYGGWVRWSLGSSATGEDSIASQVIPSSHWPEIRVLILVANAAQKETSSTDGMQRSVLTSPLLNHRASHIVEPRMRAMEQSLINRDFRQFAELTMQDSNQFHACCLDTYPPIFYLNDTSKHVIDTVTAINALSSEGPVAAYTFDAGPNAVIYTLDRHTDALVALFNDLYNAEKTATFVYDPMALAASASTASVKGEWRSVAPTVKPSVKVHQIIVSQVGEGATITGRSHTFGAPTQ